MRDGQLTMSQHESAKARRRGAVEPLLVASLWLATCSIALYMAMGYDFTPGSLGPRQAAWPPETDARAPADLARHPDKTTIVAFLHPRCVCSYASVKQLVKTMKAHPGAELIVPVFTPPDANDAAAGWADAASVQMVRAELPAARIVADRGGLQAKRFGALTSGTMLIYDADGRELFRGGITERRGGEGDNPSVQQFVRVLTGERSAQAAPSPVFGCPLVMPETMEQSSGDVRR